MAIVNMESSHESIEEENQWTAIKEIMEKMASTQEIQCDANVAMAQKGLALLEDISAESDRLRSSARAISEGISASIDDERRALGEEARELSQETSRVRELEAEVAALEGSRADTRAARRRAEIAIPEHEAAAAEEVAEVDEIEFRHVRNLPKIRQELSLHALMTNVKWDFSRRDALAGEVSLPARAEHRRFEIDKERLSDFEIAEQLWEMIEG